MNDLNKALAEPAQVADAMGYGLLAGRSQSWVLRVRKVENGFAVASGHREYVARNNAEVLEIVRGQLPEENQSDKTEPACYTVASNCASTLGAGPDPEWERRHDRMWCAEMATGVLHGTGADAGQIVKLASELFQFVEGK